MFTPFLDTFFFFFKFQAFSPLGSPGTTWLKSDVLKQPVVVSVAEKLGKTPAQVCLRWGIQMGQSVLPKSTNEARIKENLDVLNWSIPDDLLARFSEIPQVNLYIRQFLLILLRLRLYICSFFIRLISNLKSANGPRNWLYIFSVGSNPCSKSKKEK